MHKLVRYALWIVLLKLAFPAKAQHEADNWVFGLNAGLSFTSSPPSTFTNASLSTLEGCASVSSVSGQLLFYTDGIRIWNRAHAIMTNGAGLTGNSSSSQSGVIVKQPGNANIYYVFSVPAAGSGTLAYSIVDLSLSGGLGSVTSKNNSLLSPSAEKLTAVRHCNGVDVWIVTHEHQSNRFFSFQLTPSGLTPTAVISPIGTNYNGFNYAGYMKTSPSGKKLAVSVYGSCLELYDFDNASGVVSNLLTVNNHTNMYGCEFSPDGSKLYAATWFNTSPGLIYQYDLCAGSASAVTASEILVGSSAPYKGSLQLAPDGKIYAARFEESFLGVIHQPNAAGSACNYVDAGQTIFPKKCIYGLPNFLTSNFNPPPSPFTYTISNTLGCQTASFQSNYNPSVTNLACSSIGYSVTGLAWNFGDPASGSANTSTVQNPVHTFSELGLYEVTLVLYYSCGGGTDTLKQLVNISCITVTSSAISCASLGSATVQANAGVGPYSYTWMPGNQTSPVAVGLSPGVYTISVYDSGTNSTYTALATFTSNLLYTAKINMSERIPCAGVASGTGVVTSVTGGSGNSYYTWSNGSVTYTTVSTTSLSAGFWTVQVTDALTACQYSLATYISEPPALQLTLSCSSTSACAAENVSLTSVVDGGTPHNTGSAYTYSWTGLSADSSVVVMQPGAGVYVYSLSCKDSLQCDISGTIAVSFFQPPTLALQASALKGCAPFYSDFTVNTHNTSSVKTSWKVNGAPVSGNHFTYLFRNPGDYIISGYFTDSLSRCTNSSSLVVKAYDRPTANFDYEPKKPLESMGAVRFENLSEGSDLLFYQWHFIHNNGYSTLDKHASYDFSSAGVYPVALVVMNAGGCSDSIVKNIRVEPDYAFYVPNAFSPNHDDRNEVFMPLVRSLKYYDLMIFNRNGTLLFRTNDPDSGWDGSYKEQDCPQGVYVWKITLSNLEGDEKHYAGHVFLIR